MSSIKLDGLTLASTANSIVSIADTVQHVVPIVIAKRVNPQQSITTSTFTKVQFNTVEVDTHSFFDATTNYRFTPTISGYYHITTQAGLQSVGGTRFITDLYKNGLLYKRITDSAQTTNAEASHNASAIVQFNGSTDYVEIYVYVVSTNAIVIESGSNQTHFNAFLIQRT
jgi:hypothetical protein